MNHRDTTAKIAYNQRIFGHLSYAAMLHDFMVAFDQLPDKSAPVPPEAFTLSEKLVDEELREYGVGYLKFKEAQTLENATELLDGIVDSIYVLLWTAIKFNLPVHAAFLEVHRSNMAKLQEDGTVLKNEHGKVQKPAGWTPPDLFALMVAHRDACNWKGGVQVHPAAKGKGNE